MKARAVIEAEVSHIETWQKLRPETAARIEAAWLRMVPGGEDPNMGVLRQIRKQRGEPEDLPDDSQANINIGGTQYEKRDGAWYRLVKTRNPAYWSEPQYFLLYGPIPEAFIVCKMPRKLNTALWRKAIRQIWRDGAMMAWKPHEGCGVDGADQAIYDRRVAGTKPQAAYEIFADGSWKRTDRKQ